MVERCANQKYIHDFPKCLHTSTNIFPIFCDYNTGSRSFFFRTVVASRVLLDFYDPNSTDTIRITYQNQKTVEASRVFVFILNTNVSKAAIYILKILPAIKLANQQ